jgi:pimeloyl-ACP methyl ester carboxylesterase
MRVEEFLAMVREMMKGSVAVTPQIEGVALSLMHVDRDGRIRPRLSRRNHMRILRALWEQDPLELLRRVRVPVLIVAARSKGASGEDAAFIDAKRGAEGEVRAIGAHLHFEWIDSIHDVPMQRPDALARRIRRFVREDLT